MKWTMKNGEQCLAVGIFEREQLKTGGILPEK